MDRCALFVDAGYLLAEGGEICFGVKSRARIGCKFDSLVEALRKRVEDHSRLPALRVYWYDASPHAVPTQEQGQIADLPHVKLRLGRISGGKQKGVDSLIVRDLMTLGRERAMATAYLIAGDEDLREGVSAAQDMGVRVVVVGVPSLVGNQAQTLLREADEHILLKKDFLQEHLSLRGAPPAAVPARPPAAIPARKTDLPVDEAMLEKARTIGAAFAETVRKDATEASLAALRERFPSIPFDVDAALLRAGEAALGALKSKKALRNALRDGFWAKVRV